NALKIIGTDGDDDVEVRLFASDPNLVEVADLKNPPLAWTFPTNGLSAIIVDLAAGHDRVTFNTTNCSLTRLPAPDVVEDNTEAYGKTENSIESHWDMDCPADILVECAPPNNMSSTRVFFPTPIAIYRNLWGTHTDVTVTCDYLRSQSGCAYFPFGT